MSDPRTSSSKPAQPVVVRSVRYFLVLGTQLKANIVLGTQPDTITLVSTQYLLLLGDVSSLSRRLRTSRPRTVFFCKICRLNHSWYRCSVLGTNCSEFEWLFPKTGQQS